MELNLTFYPLHGVNRCIYVCVLRVSVVPNLHGPVCATRDENLWVEVVPHDLVHCHMVCIKGIQELAVVGFGTFMDLTLFCTNQEQVIGLLVEVETGTTAWVGRKCPKMSCSHLMT